MGTRTPVCPGCGSDSVFQEMIATNEIWECRMVSGVNTNRILCFSHCGDRLVLTHGFIKKIPMTPAGEMASAEQLRAGYVRRHGRG